MTRGARFKVTGAGLFSCLPIEGEAAALCLHTGAHNRRAVAQTALVDKKDWPGQPASNRQNKYSEEPPKEAQGGQPASNRQNKYSEEPPKEAQGGQPASNSQNKYSEEPSKKAHGGQPASEQKAAQGAFKKGAAHKENADQAAADVQATERGGEQEKGSAADTAAAETSKEKAARAADVQTTERGGEQEKGSAADTAAAEISKEKATRAADVQATERGGEQAKGSAADTAAAEISKEKEDRAADMQAKVQEIKRLLPAPDILVYEFSAGDGTPCAAVYADGITDKELMGMLAARPLAERPAPCSREEAKRMLLFPELREADEASACSREILAGNPALVIGGVEGYIILGTKKVALRAVSEPQTSIAVKGPREGFIEDIKTNMGLIRRRLKTPDLMFVMLEAGRRSGTAVAIAYLKGIADERVVKKAEERIRAADIDGVPDSSYIAKFLAERPRSLFKQAGTTEKPDILCAKMLEGRIAVLVDGSPIVLTLPYLLAEDFQSAQDYFVSPYRATASRWLRMGAACTAVFLPAFYVAAELFRLRLLPFDLLMTVAGGVRSIPLSPGLELFFLLLVLEVLIEASVRMPKYVALALSVIGALVLGDTAVKAGLVSSPAIIIVALSGISAYTVPDLTGTLSLVRLAFIVAAGSIGTYGILLLAALLAYYLVTTDSYGVPLLAPFSPLIRSDLKDTLYKAELFSLWHRPRVLRGKNERRLASFGKEGEEMESEVEQEETKSSAEREEMKGAAPEEGKDMQEGKSGLQNREKTKSSAAGEKTRGTAAPEEGQASAAPEEGKDRKEGKGGLQNREKTKSSAEREEMKDAAPEEGKDMQEGKGGLQNNKQAGGTSQNREEAGGRPSETP